MEKITNQVIIPVPTGFVDEGDGVVSFPNGLIITDGTVQRNGTRYDIDSLDTSKYGNQLTADHVDTLGNLIGQTIGVSKLNGSVAVNSIRYAINENPYARMAYNLLVGGFSKNFSTETIGPLPDQDGVFRNSELVGLSQVVTQNNYNAHVNKVIHNSLEQSKKDGFNVDGVEEKFLNAITATETESNKENKMEEKDKKVNSPETVTLEAGKYQATKNEDGTFTVTVDNKVEDEEAKKTEEVVTEPVAPAEGDDSKVEEKKEEKPVAPETKEENHVEDEHDSSNDKKVEEKPKKSKETKNEVEAPAKTDDEESKEKETNNKEDKMDEKDKTVETPNQDATANAIAEAVKNALAPVMTELAEVRKEQKNAFDKSAKEPEFKAGKVDEPAKNDYKAMPFEERYQIQVNAAWNAVKQNSIVAQETLREINQVNLDLLKEAKIAKNAMTLDDLGNFVIAPEMYTEIVGHRNDYSGILNATEWKETLNLEFAWLQRVGDINMQSVAMGYDTDGTDDQRLKPISEYSAIPKTSQLEELAAITVVATSTTRFAAVDLLSDAAQGYRTDYDRKRAQLVIAKLEDAIDETGFSVPYNPTSDTSADALTTWLDAITAISDTTLNGTLVFNARSFAELKSRALLAGTNGPLSELLTTGAVPTVFGYSYIVVPNDLMPSLGGSETIVFTVNGESKVINHAVFFADLTTFTGRTSGGLQYDISNSAPYEVGGVVKSAYQRNELVLRGSFFRGGAVKDVKVVAGIRQGNSANVS